MCGEDYKTIREAVARIVMEGKVEGLDEACEVLLLFKVQARTVRFYHYFMSILIFLLFYYRAADVGHNRKPFTFYYHCTEKSQLFMDKLRASIQSHR